MNNYSWNLDDDYISHFGVGHKGNPPGRGSGRYPYGSSNNVKSVRDYTVRNHYQNIDGTITKKGLEVLKNKALGMYPLILLKPINSVKLYYEDVWDEIYG